MLIFISEQSLNFKCLLRPGFVADFPGGRRLSGLLRSRHPDDPCGRDRCSTAAPKEQPAPETLRQKDRRRMGLWKVACLRTRACPPTKYAGNGESFRSPDRGGRRRRSLCVG